MVTTTVGFMVGASLISPGDRRVDVIPCAVVVPPEPQSAPSVDVICVARLVDKKGVDLLLRATSLLRAEGLDLSVTVVGDGPRRANLETLTRALGLETSVTFTGALSHEETLALIQGARVFCLPARLAPDGGFRRHAGGHSGGDGPAGSRGGHEARRDPRER